MLTGVFYGRFSSKMQNETSIEGQRIVVANYAQMNNIKIVTEYVDRAKSGKSDKRPNFKKMIDDIKNGTLDIDVVVVYKLDRFFRNEKLSHDFICVNIYKVLKNNFGYAEPYSKYTI